MKLIAFVADNANDALDHIHHELGPEAVVVSVKKLPASGISRLWQRNNRIEVTACVPQTAPEPPRSAPAPSVSVSAAVSTPAAAPTRVDPFGLRAENKFSVDAIARRPAFGRRRSVAWLESKGLLPAFADQLEQKVSLLHGEHILSTPEKEWTAVTDLIICHWRSARQNMSNTGRPHVFIGPAGAGKTTVLCKWMTSAILLNEQRVRVWRLDGEAPNTSELLSLHCETMGVPVERFWRDSFEPANLLFVDLPGVETHNPAVIAALRDQLGVLPDPHVHLVLNAACESSILFDQFRAFESCAPEDIIFTHMDEERQRVKLWNFVLGINCPISFLSAGQKIPGDFRRAEPALLFPQKNHR